MPIGDVSFSRSATSASFFARSSRTPCCWHPQTHSFPASRTYRFSTPNIYKKVVPVDDLTKTPSKHPDPVRWPACHLLTTDGANWKLRLTVVSFCGASVRCGSVFVLFLRTARLAWCRRVIQCTFVTTGLRCPWLAGGPCPRTRRAHPRFPNFGSLGLLLILRVGSRACCRKDHCISLSSRSSSSFLSAKMGSCRMPPRELPSRFHRSPPVCVPQLRRSQCSSDELGTESSPSVTATSTTSVHPATIPAAPRRRASRAGRKARQAHSALGCPSRSHVSQFSRRIRKGASQVKQVCFFALLLKGSASHAPCVGICGAGFQRTPSLLGLRLSLLHNFTASVKSQLRTPRGLLEFLGLCLAVLGLRRVLLCTLVTFSLRCSWLTGFASPSKMCGSFGIGALNSVSSSTDRSSNCKMCLAIVSVW